MCEYVTRAWNRSTLRMLTATAVAGAVVLGTTGGAMADSWKKHGRYYYAPAPVYVAPAYVAPARYYAPPPVVYAAPPPPPVVVYPAPPVAYAPPYPAPAYYAPGGSVSLGINVPLR